MDHAGRLPGYLNFYLVVDCDNRDGAKRLGDSIRELLAGWKVFIEKSTSYYRRGRASHIRVTVSEDGDPTVCRISLYTVDLDTATAVVKLVRSVTDRFTSPLGKDIAGHGEVPDSICTVCKTMEEIDIINAKDLVPGFESDEEEDENKWVVVRLAPEPRVYGHLTLDNVLDFLAAYEEETTPLTKAARDDKREAPDVPETDDGAKRACVGDVEEQ